MVVGGMGANHDVEIIDLSGSQKTCRKPADYPIHWGSNGIFFNGFASVCGGGAPTNKCYKYDSEVNNQNILN